MQKEKALQEPLQFPWTILPILNRVEQHSTQGSSNRRRHLWLAPVHCNQAHVYQPNVPCLVTVGKPPLESQQRLSCHQIVETYPCPCHTPGVHEYSMSAVEAETFHSLHHVLMMCLLPEAGCYLPLTNTEANKNYVCIAFQIMYAQAFLNACREPLQGLPRALN